VLTLVVYDISDNGVRTKLANYLKSKGFTRIQRSAFIGDPPPTLLKDVLRVIQRQIDHSRDIVHVFPVTEYTLRYMKAYGKPLADIRAAREAVEVIG